jgi:hypothetical protein
MEWNLYRFAIAYTDELSRWAYNSGTIWQIVPYIQLLIALGAYKSYKPIP